MNDMPFGVPSPVTLSQPGPVASEESVPNVNTSQRVDEELWNSALTNRIVGGWGPAKAAALWKDGGFGGLKIVPATLRKVSVSFTSTSVMASPDNS